MQKPTNKEFKSDVESIQYHISLNLLKTRRAPLVNIKLDVCQSLVTYLSTRFRINFCRFQDANHILAHLQIKTEDYYNGLDRNEGDYFQVKFIKKKTNTIKDRLGNELAATSKAQISIRFVKTNRIELNEEEREFYDLYAENQANVQP